MAEISYPFSADNATTGAAKAVSETQWQKMAHMWGGDRVDYTLTGGQEDFATLPFNAKATNVTTVAVNPGKAWVGGFYYELTAAMNVTITANALTTGRIDLIVLRADMSKPSVNLAVRKGVNAATPVEPLPVRQIGGVWELPLYSITVPASGGALVVNARAPYNIPPSVGFPWNSTTSLALLPVGTFGYDMDSNGNGYQNEYFRGRDGLIASKSLGKSATYTPNLVNCAALPTANRTGRWRWIAPNMAWFQATIVNDFDEGAMATGNNWRVGITLPAICNVKAAQTFHGYLSNPSQSGNLPNAMSVTALTQPGSSVLYLHAPDSNTTQEGLNGLKGFPANSSFTISGVFEASEISE
ncbi:hypothetical protein [Streptomyces sp. NBC_01751]|uniref:hypothetical protein n=1 Tax=Streptomyces sp. NBC_01751 TaxID=2975929 RepID=UPI002DD8091B|nr:hypothetical protein [Streptomyces sp. NBC_01751]WSD24554.1 hypothetical protein OHA26_14260 [Streptomyces sp. NBC_01751]